MKLSENTINVLKNFSTINPSILFNSGNVLKTISPVKTVYARAVVEEDFPRDFAIYDLPKMLGALSIFKDPELTFEEKFLTISEGRQKVQFKYADPSMIVAAPSKEVQLPSNNVQFTISSESFQRMMRSLGILSLPEVAISGQDGVVYMKAVNSKETGSDNFSIEVGETDQIFNAVFKAENLKLMNKDYSVTLSFKGLAEFNADNLTYFTPCESHSKF